MESLTHLTILMNPPFANATDTCASSTRTMLAPGGRLGRHLCQWLPGGTRG